MIPPAALVAKVRNLPPMPATAIELLRLLDDPETDASRIVETLQYDPAVTVAVLRLCNSAAMGVAQNVSSLQQAVVLLGMDRVVELVLAVQMRGFLGAEQEGYGMEADALWRHSIAVALACGLVDDRVPKPLRSTLFTAGLLHDIGKLVLDRFVGASYDEIHRRVRDQGIAFLDAEREVLGYDHCIVGAALARHWKVPDAIVEPIRLHHTPDLSNPPDPLVDLVHVADALCMTVGLGLGDDGLNYRVSASVLERQKIDRDRLCELAAEIHVRVSEVERTLGSAN